jgi:hypothetical protein
MALGIKKSIIQYIENFTKMTPVIQSDHTYIHAGIGFTAVKKFGSISSVVYMELTTPAAGTYVHFRPADVKISSSADSVEYTLYENVSATGGAAYTPFNRNRNSGTTSTMTVATGVTATPGSAVILDTFFVGTAGNAATRSGGAGGGGEEIILKPSTTYIMSFTPAGATSVSVSVFWYEEEAT